MKGIRFSLTVCSFFAVSSLCKAAVPFPREKKHPHNVILMHTNVCEDVASISSALNQTSFTTSEISVIAGHMEIPAHTPMRDLPYEARREHLLAALDTLVAVRREQKRRRLVGLDDDTSPALRSLRVEQTSERYLSHLQMDIVRDPEGLIDSEELSSLANSLPCRRGSAVPDLILPPESFHFDPKKVKANFPEEVAEAMKRHNLTLLEESGDVKGERILQETLIPDDPKATEQWYLETTNTLEAWSRFTAWEESFIVAVVDSGASHHPDLAPNLWVDMSNPQCKSITPTNPSLESGCYGWDFSSNDGNPLDEVSYHGTGVSGMIAATAQNDFMTAGVCWGCKILSLKVTEPDGTALMSNILAAYDYLKARPQIRLSNHSYSGYGYYEPQYLAIQSLLENHHLFITAAGNELCDVDAYTGSIFTPNVCSDGIGLLRPGGFDLDNILTVGATDRYGIMAYFSNWGEESVDVFAPGADVPQIWNTRDEPLNGYKSISGTSFSSPFVAGVAALIWSSKPDLTYIDVKKIITDTVKKVPSLADKCQSGGIVDVLAALEEANGKTDSSAAPKQSTPSTDLTDYFYTSTAAPVAVSSLWLVIAIFTPMVM